MDEHAIKAHLEDLRRQFPSLPVLRDFQVIFSNFQSQWQSILRWTFWSLHWMHMTRTISWSPFLPGMGRLFPCCCSGICCLPVQTPWHAKILPFFPGSITIVVTPTTTIGQQLVADCQKLGITALSGAQVMLDIFLAWHGIFPCLNIYVINQSFPSPPHISSKV